MRIVTAADDIHGIADALESLVKPLGEEKGIDNVSIYGSIECEQVD